MSPSQRPDRDSTSRRKRQPQAQQPPQQGNTFGMGVALVAVAIAFGIVLLIKGGSSGFDTTAADVTVETPAVSEVEDNPSEVTEETIPTPTTSVPAAELNVVTLNGAGISGFAGSAANFLNVAGYSQVTADNAATPVEATAIHFIAGFEEDAKAVARVFGVDDARVTATEDANALTSNAEGVPEGTQVVVVLGSDVQGAIDAADSQETPSGDESETAE